MIDLEVISAEELTNLIGSIYNCALDPQRWQSTCQQIAEFSRSTAGGIFVHDLRHVQNKQPFVFGYQPEFLQMLENHYAENSMAAASIGSNNDDRRERYQLLETRFFQEVLKPYGLQDMVCFPMVQTAERMISLHASRSENEPDFQQRDLNFFKILSPHVCRALAISEMLDIRTARSEMLENTLDGLVAGVFLTARDGQVVYLNHAAECQIKMGNAIHLVNNRIVPTDLAARNALAKAMEEAARDDAVVNMGEHFVAIPAGFGGGYIATLLPIENTRRHGILASFAASVAVFMQDPVQATCIPGDAFAKLHGLTGGELRVLLALSQGLSGTEAADILGISEPTIRTHLQHMFSKTGTSKQLDLLQLLHHSTPPIRTLEPAH
ncbi:helix-turn-helix transcriptional regulator [Acidovorax sp. JHL-9]|uniref:helix-turn-helix transcriptional regulator n=1 Tax=Acidovorax sp. JHL-9 TaxID=1276756 RepID=UPI00040E71CC|nr:helix-turn-helix transcriptional regulator [Acidovorax sp. JHL-9]